MTDAWMAAMASLEARTYYRSRAMVIERPNAIVKGQMGQRKVPVRGVEKVRSWFLLVAVVVNLMG
ncbi:MAG: hypothetical protein EOO74_09320, partial [Myxococcales bacterium]